MQAIPGSTEATSSLPLNEDVRVARAFSLIAAALMGVMSLAGLSHSLFLYPTEEMKQFYLANDLVNLVIGLPVLLGSLWLVDRRMLVGLLLWPGALLYVTYNYLAYLFGVPAGLITIGYLMLPLLTSYAVFDLLRKTNRASVRERLVGAVPARTAGWVLALFGTFFLFRATAMLAGAIGGQIRALTEIGLLVADLTLSVVWIAGGVALLRRLPLGYAGGLGLLFVGSMLFIGLILVLVLRPVLTNAPILVPDLLVVSLMGLTCFIPFVLYARGVLASRNAARTSDETPQTANDGA